MASEEQLNAAFAALADPNRRAILSRLSLGEASVKELIEPLDITPPAVTKHLKVLERAGLISRGRQAQWRPCRLEVAPLLAVADWLEPYLRDWADRFDRLDEHLKALQMGEETQDPGRGATEGRSDRRPENEPRRDT